MTEHVVDLEQRRTAIRPDGSYLVQAPAGSGKTELLIQRYLRLLAVVDAPEEIVAITFTRKAAAEMRGRIIHALERVAVQEPVTDEAAQQTVALAGAAMARNREKDWQLQDNPGRLRIQTIDSLCAALTRQMPVLSRFGAQPKVLEDARELYAEAAAATLAELESGSGWSDAIAVLLVHLDNNLPRVRDMLAGMLQRRDQWLRHVAGEIRRDALEKALRHVVEDTLDSARQAFPAAQVGELTALLEFAADNLNRDGSASALAACRGLTELPPAGVQARDLWDGIVTLLLTDKGNWRKQADVRLGFPAAGNGKAEAELRRAMKDRYKGLLARLAEDETLRRSLVALRGLPPPAYTEAEWTVVQALCELLKLADAQLRLLFAERNQIDFSGITQAAVLALGGEYSPTDLALNLDYRIRHILVDEYQDISINQYTLLQRLTAGWSPEDGHTLFLVGDPMQSIYRFREAEVGLFLNTRERQRLGQVAVTPLQITVNFRSQSGIVDWVNETFARVLPETADVGRGAVDYTPAQAFHAHPDRAAVTLHPIIGRDDRREADIVLQQIHAAREAAPGGSIAVLVRSRPHLSVIVPMLKQAGLRFRAVEIEPLGTQPSIQDLLALTRALHHYADRVAWLALLRAPWCGLELADLLRLAGDGRDLSVWECLQDEDRVARLSTAGQRRIQRLCEVLGEALAHRQRRPVRRWVQSVWMRLGGPATLKSETDLENARAFFDLLDRFDDGGDLKDREGFMGEVEKLYAAADVHADERLQIMTIHKAKGLEFDTVILPGLGRGRRNDEARLLRWAENPHLEHQDLLLAPVQAAGEAASPVYDFLKRLEQQKQSFEDGRMLYVAATRARRRLHLIGAVETRQENGVETLRTPRTDSLLAQLWPVVETDFRAALERGDRIAAAVESVAEMPRTLRRLRGDWRLPPPPVPTWEALPGAQAGLAAAEDIEYEWAGMTIRHIGTVVHRCLQRIAGDGIASWDADRINAARGYYRLSLQRLGVPEAELDDACERVAEALQGLLNDETGRWLMDAAHKEARNEYAVSGLHDGGLVTIIIDRTFVDAEGRRWIVDYKTSSHEGGDRETFLDREQARYRDQLQKYAVVMAQMDDRPIRLGLYFPLLAGWRDWEYRPDP
jgi:ATP-dependent helicase/nuclease subunit A